MSKSICYRTGSNNILSNPSVLVFRKKVVFLGWQIHLLPSFPTQVKAVLSREQSRQNQSSVPNRYWQSKEPVPIGFRVPCSIILFYQQNALLEITDTNSHLLMRDRDTLQSLISSTSNSFKACQPGYAEKLHWNKGVAEGWDLYNQWSSLSVI